MQQLEARHEFYEAELRRAGVEANALRERVRERKRESDKLQELLEQEREHIEKKVAKMTKLMEKSTKKRKSSQNKVSGFEKPTAISDELAKFVGEPVGTMLARTAVSKKIHEYVKSNNLQNPTNRRIIIPDAKLKKLLKTSGTDELSYFNLQKFLKVHFKKDVKA
jgi:chromatin remodeling complex protein RSC6